MNSLTFPPGTAEIGSRLTLRMHDPEGGFRDIVGVLESATTVRKSDGSLVYFEPSKIAIWKKIEPPSKRAGHGAPLSLRIREIEIAANATWPAGEEKPLGDWVLRATGKFTMRANSTLPLGDAPYGNPGMPIQEAINTAITFYLERGLPPIFHISLPTYAPLDELLEAQGWQKKLPVLVMVADITAEPASQEFNGIWEIQDHPSDEWLSVQNDHGVKSIMESVPGNYLALRINGELIAVGRGANYKDWTSLTRLYIREEFRGQGIGSELVHRILNQSLSQGANKAVLQVDSENLSAINLYQKMGFTTHHSYLYRSLPEGIGKSGSC